MYLKIDNWLFDKVFQPFSDWFCDQTRRNPFWLAATSMYLFIAGTLTNDVLFTRAWSGKLLDAMLCVYFIFRAFSYDKKSRAPKKFSLTLNPLRSDKFHQIVRVFSAIILPFDGFKIFVNDPEKIAAHSHVLNFLLSVSFFLFLYFEACETKPPAPPKKKEELKLARAAT